MKSRGFRASPNARIHKRLIPGVRCNGGSDKAAQGGYTERDVPQMLNSLSGSFQITPMFSEIQNGVSYTW